MKADSIGIPARAAIKFQFLIGAMKERRESGAAK